VKTADQATFLREQRCDRAQGYFFARPTEASDLDGLLSTDAHNWWDGEGVRRSSVSPPAVAVAQKPVDGDGGQGLVLGSS